MLHRRLGRVGVTAGLAACLSLLSVQGAAAEQTNASDPGGDVVTVEFDAGPNGNDTVAKRHPARAYGDIRHMHANHTYDRVAVSLRYRDLTASLGRVGNYFEFKTGRSHFYLDFDHTRKHPDPQSEYFYNETQNTVVDCPGLTVAIERAEDRVRIGMPRSCLDNPKWVRVGAETWTGNGYYDDALRRGRSVIGWQFGPVVGPRLTRGPAPQQG